MDLNDKVTLPLGDADIRGRLFDKSVKIIVYEDLANYKNIQQLLPRSKDAVIMLYQRKENYGHWVAILRNKNNIVFFDPYGCRPDKQLLWTPKYLREQLNQKTPHLSHLLNSCLEDGFKVSFNQTAYQKDENAVNTCGRHCVSVVNYWMRSVNPSLSDYYKLMKKYKDDNELENFDLSVSKLIS
jgi:hypothetical protein